MWDAATERTMRGHARALAAKGRGRWGIEPDDLLHEAWLAWVDGIAQGWTTARCAVRARGAMLDALRAASGVPWDHRTGAALGEGCEVLPSMVREDPAPRQRTRLPHRVRSALRKLPTWQREALRLAFVEGWTPTIAAEVFAVPVGTVASQRHRSASRLRTLVTGGTVADTRTVTPPWHRGHT